MQFKNLGRIGVITLFALGVAGNVSAATSSGSDVSPGALYASTDVETPPGENPGFVVSEAEQDKGTPTVPAVAGLTAHGHDLANNANDEASWKNKAAPGWVHDETGPEAKNLKTPGGLPDASGNVLSIMNTMPPNDVALQWDGCNDTEPTNWRAALFYAPKHSNQHTDYRTSTAVVVGPRCAPRGQPEVTDRTIHGVAQMFDAAA